MTRVASSFITFWPKKLRLIKIVFVVLQDILVILSEAINNTTSSSSSGTLKETKTLKRTNMMLSVMKLSIRMLEQVLNL